MAKNTLYGFVESNGSATPDSTFRLHLGRGVDPVRDLHLLVAVGSEQTWDVKQSSLTLRLYIRTYPSGGSFYERELYVSWDKDAKDRAVLHLKEGPRFFETTADDTFPLWLGLFLGVRIPGTAEKLQRK